MGAKQFCVLTIMESRAKIGASKMHLTPPPRWLRLLSALRLWFYCLMYFPLCVVVLCWSLVCYALLCVHFSFPIILKRSITLCLFEFCNHIEEEEKTGCFAIIVN